MDKARKTFENRQSSRSKVTRQPDRIHNVGLQDATPLLFGALLLATALSLLRLSVGCHFLRFVALIGILLIIYRAWEGKAELGNLTDVAIWAYTFYSFGPSSWRFSLYSPLGVFGKMKT